MNDLQRWFMVSKQNGQQQSQISYLAIVGSGGLGKTTLAMSFYRKFGDEFDSRAFMLASQKFHLPTVLRSLVSQFHQKQVSASQDALHGIEEWGVEALKKKLADQLHGKRYRSWLCYIYFIPSQVFSNEIAIPNLNYDSY